MGWKERRVLKERSDERGNKRGKGKRTTDFWINIRDGRSLYEKERERIKRKNREVFW